MAHNKGMCDSRDRLVFSNRSLKGLAILMLFGTLFFLFLSFFASGIAKVVLILLAVPYLLVVNRIRIMFHIIVTIDHTGVTIADPPTNRVFSLPWEEIKRVYIFYGYKGECRILFSKNILTNQEIKRTAKRACSIKKGHPVLYANDCIYLGVGSFKTRVSDILSFVPPHVTIHNKGQFI